MIKRLENLKNTVNKYMADIQPDRLTTCQSERKSVVSRRPSVFRKSRICFCNNITNLSENNLNKYQNN
jgi:hypothetical protein